MNILLLGPPGVGKGTVGKLLAAMLGIPHFSTGERGREELQKNTAFGKLWQKVVVEQNSLIPDEPMVEFVQEKMNAKEFAKGVVFDAFPRTVGQAELLEKASILIDKVFFLNAPDPVILKRLAYRMLCSRCQHAFNELLNPEKKKGVCDLCAGILFQREEDKPENIPKRLQDYYVKTAPLIAYYTAKGILVEVSAVGSPQEILEEVRRKIGKK